MKQFTQVQMDIVNRTKKNVEVYRGEGASIACLAGALKMFIEDTDKTILIVTNNPSYYMSLLNNFGIDNAGLVSHYTCGVIGISTSSLSRGGIIIDDTIVEGNNYSFIYNDQNVHPIYYNKEKVLNIIPKDERKIHTVWDQNLKTIQLPKVKQVKTQTEIDFEKDLEEFFDLLSPILKKIVENEPAPKKSSFKETPFNLDDAINELITNIQNTNFNSELDVTSSLKEEEDSFKEFCRMMDLMSGDIR